MLLLAPLINVTKQTIVAKTFPMMARAMKKITAVSATTKLDVRAFHGQMTTTAMGF